jgi:hypothetical protein
MLMDFPFTQPICSDDDAALAMHAVHWWRAQSIEDGHEIADRIIEIAAFRITQLWRDTEGAGVGLYTSDPIFVTQTHDEMLLAPATHLSRVAAPTPCSQHPSATGFFESASCFNLLGSQVGGELFRRIMGTRFGLPVGTSAIIHLSSSWPRPLLWRGFDATLNAMMTTEHRVRREAGLLRLTTEPAPHAPGQRRL